jgi:hypothetical protein
MRTKPVDKLKVGDRIHIQNKQLDSPLTTYDKNKIFSAIVSDLTYDKYGDDYRYQLELGNYTSGWYDPGYLIMIPTDYIAISIEAAAIEEEN